MITDRTAFAAGNHSVSITAADTIGLTAQNVVSFTLGNGTRTNCEFDYWWKHGSMRLCVTICVNISGPIRRLYL